MCLSALQLARVKRVVFGAYDLRLGAVRVFRCANTIGKMISFGGLRSNHMSSCLTRRTLITRG